MNVQEIKLDIKEQISKTNESFTNYWGRLFMDGLLSNDLDILSKLLKKITKYFKINVFVSIALSAIMIIFSIFVFFEFIDSGSMDKAGLAILFTVVFLTNLYSSYKVKTNLENKIYLLELLSKVEKD